MSAAQGFSLEVIARDIALILSGSTFSSPQDFRDKLTQLLRSRFEQLCVEIATEILRRHTLNNMDAQGHHLKLERLSEHGLRSYVKEIFDQLVRE